MAKNTEIESLRAELVEKDSIIEALTTKSEAYASKYSTLENNYNSEKTEWETKYNESTTQFAEKEKEFNSTIETLKAKNYDLFLKVSSPNEQNPTSNVPVPDQRDNGSEQLSFDEVLANMF